jgi:hypothetical protein
MKLDNKGKIIFTLILILLGVFYRFVDHPPNFSPLAAIALFSGFYLGRKWSFLIPLSILLLSDIFLGFYQLPILISVYFCFAASSFIGIWLKNKKNFINILGASMTGSLLFFAVTNFSVWFFGNWYPKDFRGLLECYYMAVPFFKNTFAGDLFFVGMFFGIYEMALLLERKYFLKYGFSKRKDPVSL